MGFSGFPSLSGPPRADDLDQLRHHCHGILILGRQFDRLEFRIDRFEQNPDMSPNLLSGRLLAAIALHRETLARIGIHFIPSR